MRNLRKPTSIRAAKGFTLLELVVVIIIVGILAAAATIAYNQFIGQANDSNGLSAAKAADVSIQASAAADGVINTADITAVTMTGATLGTPATAGDGAISVTVSPVKGTEYCLAYAATSGAVPAGTNPSFTKGDC